MLRYRGDIIVRTIGQAPVTASGDYTMVKFRDETMVAYSLPGAKSENLNNTIAYFIQETIAPARLAGDVLLVQETLTSPSRIGAPGFTTPASVACAVRPTWPLTTRARTRS